MGMPVFGLFQIWQWTMDNGHFGQGEAGCLKGAPGQGTNSTSLPSLHIRYMQGGMYGNVFGSSANSIDLQ